MASSERGRPPAEADRDRTRLRPPSERAGLDSRLAAQASSRLPGYDHSRPFTDRQTNAGLRGASGADWPRRDVPAGARGLGREAGYNGQFTSLAPEEGSDDLLELKEVYEERLLLVLQMIGISNPEDMSTVSIDKFHREIDKGLKSLMKIEKGSTSRNGKDMRATVYLDKLLTVLDVLEIEESESVLQLSSREFSSIIEASLSKRLPSRGHIKQRDEAVRENNELRKVLDREHDRTLQLQTELEQARMTIKDLSTKNNYLGVQLDDLKRENPGLKLANLKPPKQSSRLDSSHDSHQQPPEGDPYSTVPKQPLQPSELLALIAKRMCRLSSPNTPALFPDIHAAIQGRPDRQDRSRESPARGRPTRESAESQGRAGPGAGAGRRAAGRRAGGRGGSPRAVGRPTARGRRPRGR
jgi:hypothetical protein